MFALKLKNGGKQTTALLTALTAIQALCFIMLIIGLINPKWALSWIEKEKQRRKNVLKYFGGGFIILVILISFIPSNSTNKNKEQISTK